MSTETKAKSLFASAKKAPEKKKDEKKVVTVSGIAEKIRQFNEINAKMANMETELTMLKGELNAIGKEQYLKLYEQEKRHPGSFKLNDENENVLFIAMDKYLKVTEEKAQVLACYENLVDTKTVYEINAEILAKEGVGEAISEAIWNCAALSQEDKESLLIAKEEHFVKKGTIERLMQYDNPREIFNLIQPITQLKNSK